MLKIPVICNGGISSYKDAIWCLKKVGCDGVMSSEAILENPSLYNKKYVDMDVLIQEYLDFVEKYEDNPQFVKSHLHKMAYMGF